MNILSKVALCGLVLGASAAYAIPPYRLVLPMAMRYVRPGYRPVYRPVPVVHRVVPVRRVIPVHRVPVFRPFVNPFFVRPALYRPIVVQRPVLRPLILGAVVRRGGCSGGICFR